MVGVYRMYTLSTVSPCIVRHSIQKIFLIALYKYLINWHLHSPNFNVFIKNALYKSVLCKDLLYKYIHCILYIYNTCICRQ